MFFLQVKIGSSGGDSKTEDSKTGAKTEQSTEPPKTVPMPPKEKSRLCLVSLFIISSLLQFIKVSF